MIEKRILLAFGMALFSSVACLATDIKDTVETLNKGVSLLQEIDKSGTWKYLTEGVDAIEKADGYAGTLTVTRGATNDAGDTITTVQETLVWNIQTDADDDSMIEVVRDGETRNYLIVDNQTYRVEDGQYICLESGNLSEDEFATGLDGVFVKYSAESAGVQVISIAEAEGTETVNGFETDKYKLVSKLQEALDILAELPSDELQKEIDGVPEFYIDGALYIDKETKALVKFDAKYADLDKKEGNTFAFELIQLGGQPNFTMPDPSQISQPCTTTPTATP